MAKLRTPVLQVGNLTGRNIQKAIKKVKDKGIGNHEIDREHFDMSRFEASNFGIFLEAVIDAFQDPDEESLRKSLGVKIDTTAPPSQFSQHFWNHYAEKYLIGANLTRRIMSFQTLLENFYRNDKGEKETFLSLGSGFGLSEIYLANLFQALDYAGLRFICLDNAVKMVEASRKISKTVRVCDLSAEIKPLTNLEYLHANMESIPLASRSVDQIFCFDVLQWVEDWRKAVDEMARVINPTGLATIHLSTRIRPLTMGTEDGKVVRRIGDFTVPELFDYLERRSFRVVNTRQVMMGPSRENSQQANDNIFVRAIWTKGGVQKSWRKKEASFGFLGILEVE